MAILAIVALVALVGAATALADGDPASDILVGQPLFLPWDAGVSSMGEARLEGVLSASARAGFPIRVALIAAPADLGTVTPLWDKPASYAEYLGTELSLVFHGQVLVVMPDGYGLYSSRPLPPAERSAVSSLGAPGGASGLARGATAAVEQLARSVGKPLAPVSPRASTPVAAGSSHVVSWIALLGGAGLIALAWGASLTVRPPRWRRRVPAA